MTAESAIVGTVREGNTTHWVLGVRGPCKCLGVSPSNWVASGDSVPQFTPTSVKQWVPLQPYSLVTLMNICVGSVCEFGWFERVCGNKISLTPQSSHFSPEQSFHAPFEKV